MKSHHMGHLVCTTCFRLRSLDTDPSAGPPDLCVCVRTLHPGDRWTDEQLVACKVCAACGLAVAAGHTRWRSLHCSKCRPLVREVNERAGKMLVPFGIHSIANQLPASSPAELTSSLSFMGVALERLQHHVDQTVAKNLSDTGLNQLAVVDFRHYVDACRSRRVDERDGWAALMAFVVSGTSP